MRRLAVLLAVMALGGCATYHGAVSDDFYKPPAASDSATAKLPMALKIVADQGVRDLAMSQTSGFTYNVKYGAALVAAMEQALGGIFQSVTTVDAAAPARDPNTVYAFLSFRADHIWAQASVLDYKIDLNLKDASLTTRIGTYSYSGREPYTVTGSVERALLNGLTLSILLPVLGTMENEAQGTAMEASMKKAIAASVKEVRDAIASDANLRQFVQPGKPSGPPPRVAAAAAAALPPAALPTPPRFPSQPVVARFPRVAERPDDIAVIIGNADYTRQGRDIPDVRPAHADAEGARLYAMQALGIKEGNIIVLKDATGSQMTRVFGSERDPRGQLFDWVKPGKSRVFVYYSGHGAPGGQGGSPYLIPTDSDAARIELNGYPLKQLYDNLGKLPADNVTVVLEACFSGVSPAGSVLGKASPVFFEVKAPSVPSNVTVITAGAANQMASWEQDESSGLFTKYFLKGMAGEADADKDGRVSLDELDRYLKDTLSYYARRHYGRDQNAQIVKGGGR